MSVMKKLFLAFLILLSCPFLIHTQAMNSGSAKTLEGNIFILTCFTSVTRVWDDEWSGPLPYEAKVARLHYKDLALDWLKKQALKYNITINFTEEIIGLDKDIIYEQEGFGGGGSKYNGLLSKLGYNNQEAFYNYVKKNTNCDNFLILQFTSTYVFGKDGLAYTQNNANDTEFFLEGALLFILVNDYYAIAHEILHCFGAWDLYNEVNKTAGAKLVINRFPYTIMDMVRIGNTSPPIIDPLTAWRIGWNKNPESWFYDCDPHK